MLDRKKFTATEDYETTLDNCVTKHLTKALAEKGAESRDGHDWNILGDYKDMVKDENVLQPPAKLAPIISHSVNLMFPEECPIESVVEAIAACDNKNVHMLLKLSLIHI